MTWNFRLVKHRDRKTSMTWYGVHEVFYNDSGKPWSMTHDPVDVTGDSAKEILKYIQMIQSDLKRLPILDAQKTRWAKPPRGAAVNRGKKYKSSKEFMSELRK